MPFTDTLMPDGSGRRKPSKRKQNLYKNNLTGSPYLQSLREQEEKKKEMQRKSKRKIVTKRILSSNSSSEEVVKSVKIGRIQSVQDFPTVLNDLFGNYVSESLSVSCVSSCPMYVGQYGFCQNI
jgi:hypothetical protein